MTIATIDVRITRYRAEAWLGREGGNCESHQHANPVPATCFASFGPGGLGIFVDLCDECAAKLVSGAVLV